MSNPVPDDVERTFDDVLDDIRREFKRASVKHPGKTPAEPTMSDGVRFPVLVEEVGEAAELCPCNNFLVKLGDIARAMTYDEGSTEKLEAELTQVATMATAWVTGLRLKTRLQREGV